MKRTIKCEHSTKNSFNDEYKFDDAEKRSGRIKDLTDELDAKGLKYKTYYNKTNNGGTIFYENDGTVVFASTDSVYKSDDDLWNVIDDDDFDFRGVQDVYYSEQDNIVVVFNHSLRDEEIEGTAEDLLLAFRQYGYPVHDWNTNGSNVFILSSGGILGSANQKLNKMKYTKSSSKVREFKAKPTSRINADSYIDVKNAANVITDYYTFDNLDDKFQCIQSIRESFGDDGKISEEELREFVSSHNGSRNIGAANYGGAYDVLPDQYFTKDDIVQFAEHVCDILNESYEQTFKIYDVDMIEPKVLYLAVTEPEDGGIYDCKIKIDMRKIRNYRSLRDHYADEAVITLMKQIDAAYDYDFHHWDSVNSSTDFDDDDFDEIMDKDSVVNAIISEMHVSKKIANIIYGWYEAEDAIEDFDEVADVVKFIRTDIYDMLDACTDETKKDAVYKALKNAEANTNSRTKIQNSTSIVWPWKMVGRYKDDYEAEVGGFDESECMEKLIALQPEHGDLIWYSGYSDEDYESGEYIGRDNFIESSTDSKHNVNAAYDFDNSPSKYRKLIKEIQDSIYNESSRYLKNRGWDMSDIADYLVVEVDMVDTWRVKAEVRCELNYEELTELTTSLDKVISKFDKYAYFEPVEPGIAEAYIDLVTKNDDDDDKPTWKDKIMQVLDKYEDDAVILKNDGEYAHVGTGSSDTLRAIAKELNIPSNLVVDSPVDHVLYIPMRPIESSTTVKASSDDSFITVPYESLSLVDELGYSSAVQIVDNKVYADPTTLKQLKNELADNDVFATSYINKRSKVIKNKRNYSVRYTEVYNGQDADAQDMFDKFEAKIAELHPYDDANYAWADISDGVIEYRDQNGELLNKHFYLNADDMDVENENWCDEIINMAIEELNRLNSTVSPKIVHSNTGVSAGTYDYGYSSFQDPALQPPEYDEPEYDNFEDVVEVSIDHILLHVNDDGSWEYDNGKYDKFSSNYIGADWYDDRYDIRLDDVVGVVEKIDDLIEPNIPSKPGDYTMSLDAELVYFVSIPYDETEYRDGSYSKDIHYDDVEVDYEKNKSKIKSIEIK